MPAYVIASIEVTDPVLYEDYRRQVAATIAAHGGRFLVRGGATRTLEGDWAPKRAVVLEFPDAAALQRWYDSPEYAPLLALRKRAARSTLVVMDGVAP